MTIPIPTPLNMQEILQSIHATRPFEQTLVVVVDHTTGKTTIQCSFCDAGEVVAIIDNIRLRSNPTPQSQENK
jgi:hypothetical protein